jgi:hypothetical protein
MSAHRFSYQRTHHQVGTPVAASACGFAMKTKSFWIETVALGTVTACLLALLIAILAGATATVAEHTVSAQATSAQTTPAQATDSSAVPPPSVQPQSYEGMVTCSHCGAKHPAALHSTAADCTRQCVHGGSSFALVDGDRTYLLEGDLGLLKKFAGQRAHIMGVIRGNTITVSSVATLS